MAASLLLRKKKCCSVAFDGTTDIAKPDAGSGQVANDPKATSLGRRQIMPIVLAVCVIIDPNQCRCMSKRLLFLLQWRKSQMRRVAPIVALSLALGTGLQAHAQQSHDPRVADLVQAGALQFGLGLGTPMTAVKDPTTGEVKGVALEMGRALAARIGVKFLSVEYPRPGAVIDGLRTNAWDVSKSCNRSGTSGAGGFFQSMGAKRPDLSGTARLLNPQRCRHR